MLHRVEGGGVELINLKFIPETPTLAIQSQKLGSLTSRNLSWFHSPPCNLDIMSWISWLQHSIHLLACDWLTGGSTTHLDDDG